MNTFRLALAGIIVFGSTLPIFANAESVDVKYRGLVDLAPFQCEWLSRSSFIKRLCYDAKEQYVVVNLTGIYYHYCEVPGNIVSGWRQVESMGRYYNSRVKGRFDCRVFRVPTYNR
ncbi:KTSC domain-containing protein [Candidatus Accumulibacter sp. ACC007]|uniref:KTSC domain-containing protein n=1 Tax=Candidatus Accumulibacter sp. ACC007 TaxID=2823333 RepID=UPI003428717D